MEHPSGRFGKLTIRGFRRLLDVSLELRPLTVLIGANGCGKTSVLDVLKLLSSSAQGKLGSAISDLSGISSVLTYDRAEELEVGLTAQISHADSLSYWVKLRSSGVGYAIQAEQLLEQQSPEWHQQLHLTAIDGGDISYFDPARKLLSPATWSHNRFETVLSQAPKMLPTPESFRRRLVMLTAYHTLRVDRRSAVRLPQPLNPAELPGKDGEDLISCLFGMRENHRDKFELVEATLRTAYPRFERLEFPPVAAGTLGLAWREQGFSKPLYAHQLSEGTLRYLWLTALLQSPGLPALTLIDEPEVSLHPELLSLLVDQLRDASNRTQLVVATHSESLIRFLDPKEIVVCDSDEDGMTTLTRADELNLDDWLKDYSLDELWRNGRLGARA